MKLEKEKHDKREKKKSKHSSKDREKDSEPNGKHKPSSKMQESDSQSGVSSSAVKSEAGDGEMHEDVKVGPDERTQDDGQEKSSSPEINNNKKNNKQKTRSKSSKERHNHKEKSEQTADQELCDVDGNLQNESNGDSNQADEGHGCESEAAPKQEADEPQAAAPVKIKKKRVKDEKSPEKHDDKNQTSGKKRKKQTSEHDKAEKNKKIKKGGDEEDKKKKKGKKEDKKDEESDKWKWWEEGKLSDSQKWSSLEHKGPYFPPEYEPLPDNVCFYYDGQTVKLSPATEEIATFYAKMLDHEYTTKEVFQNNFFGDWREVMTKDERKLIKTLSKCDFSQILKYFVEKSEERKNMTKEEKQVLKDEANRLMEEYGYCLLDGHREKIGNFKLEPPGLFRGRGEHPKMGKLKKRIQPEDVTINCSEDSKVPEPPAGHQWKRVQHDNTVTWLASWLENIHGRPKYIMLNPSSKLKGEKDWQKYETARRLKMSVDSIRKRYRRDWKSREMKSRQRGVAIYFIDKLALRAGNEKDDESADTVGCCSLRVEHIRLHRRLDGQEHVVEFDFLGKDSIRYYNKVPVEKQVFKNLKLFIKHKDPEDDLFDRITTINLNKTLNESMSGLTAKVFRTFNASTTLQDQLNKLTTEDMTVEEKILSYNRANRAVAILCNHQRAAPKTFEKSMQLLQEKIQKKKEQIEEAKKELKEAKKAHKDAPSDKSKKLLEKKEKAVQRLCEQLKKLQLQETDREENKVIALGTSKLNYLDPRITVAWCKKHQVPIEKIYNKTQRDKFAWAIDMTDENFQF
ncbi:DNA topoisomerase I, mitochondrial isoform X1 [Labeo rohita]|uniref:DNA topoisomerase I, mitochondrial isoform X1 n=1 Tax=Labeo rohita TaxID=84645 RepID=UPI0021E1D08C|nr:DNA topoisomerase I, mitochondrial isoform X1 [Labeo rohita]XP_050954391.1 DNA topoisomerase I, mitochondrial isoform X1 [Labeo rohita]